MKDRALEERCVGWVCGSSKERVGSRGIWEGRQKEEVQSCHWALGEEDAKDPAQEMTYAVVGDMVPFTEEDNIWGLCLWWEGCGGR